MANDNAFDAPYIAGGVIQENEYYLRRITEVFPERASDPRLVYGDARLEFYRLVNAGEIAVSPTDESLGKFLADEKSNVNKELKKLFVGKGEQSLNVLDYGVKLDGTDQTANINKVLAMKKPVTFPQGTYPISGTIIFNQNGVVTTLGNVVFQIMEGCTRDNFTRIVRRNGDITEKSVVLDHARLGRGIVGSFMLKTSPGMSYIPNTVALGVSEEFIGADNGQEPMNLFYSPKLAGCEWAIFGTPSPVATAGGLTGNSYINLQSSCYNGIYLGQNQDDIVFSGSTRIRSVRGVGIKKDGGRNHHFDGVFIGFKQGATGVLIEKGGNTISFGFLFIETEDKLTPVYPVVIDGGTQGGQQCAIHVLGSLTTNTPDGTNNVIIRGNRDKFFIGAMAGLDWNTPHPNSTCVRLDHAPGQRTLQYGRIYYEGALDDRVLTVNPDVTNPQRSSAENSIIEVITKSESGRYHFGKYYSDQAAFDSKPLEPLLINEATKQSDAYAPLYAMDRNYIIRMRGRVIRNGAAPEFLQNLPEEHRPKTNKVFPVDGGLVTVRADGVMSTTVPAGSTFHLDAISYKVGT